MYGQFNASPSFGYNVTPGPHGPTAVQVPSPPSYTKPQWVEELFTKLGNIEEKLSKLDKMDSTLDLLSVRTSKMENEIKELRTTVMNLEESATFHEQQYTDLESKVRINGTKIADLSKLVSTASNDKLLTEICALREKVVDVQARSMRDNLVFCGIQEDGEEDTRHKLGEFLKNELKIDSTIDFDRVHRIGGPRARKPRPIVAKFSHYKDRDVVRRAAFAELKGTHFYVNEQFPKEIEDKRKQLYPVRRAAYRAGDNVRLAVDRLYINGSLYEHGNLSPARRATS